MPIHFVTGDLFANEYHVDAFGHDCNSRGSMGAGIAVGFRERYLDVYEEYRRRCKAVPGQLNPGDCFLWKASGSPWAFSLATQEDYWRSRASYETVERALTVMRMKADAEGVRSVAIPRIGTGYGGLSWKKLRPIIERTFADWTSDL